MGERKICDINCVTFCQEKAAEFILHEWRRESSGNVLLLCHLGTSCCEKRCVKQMTYRILKHQPCKNRVAMVMLHIILDTKDLRCIHFSGIVKLLIMWLESGNCLMDLSQYSSSFITRIFLILECSFNCKATKSLSISQGQV